MAGPFWGVFAQNEQKQATKGFAFCRIILTFRRRRNVKTEGGKPPSDSPLKFPLGSLGRRPKEPKGFLRGFQGGEAPLVGGLGGEAPQRAFKNPRFLEICLQISEIRRVFEPSFIAPNYPPRKHPSGKTASLPRPFIRRRRCG